VRRACHISDSVSFVVTGMLPTVTEMCAVTIPDRGVNTCEGGGAGRRAAPA
jgi:hypothetical protein